jgi:Protein of unknown function (DUF1573).
MNLRFFAVVALLSILLSLFSCNRGNDVSEVYYDTPFDEITDIAKGDDRMLCIVLIDTSECSFSGYLNRKNEFCKPEEVPIYNLVNKDSASYHWLSKILLPQVYPITCVLNSSGELIDVIPGDSKESFLYIDKVISDKNPAMEFHYNRLYSFDKSRFLKAANLAINIQQNQVARTSNVNSFDSVFQDLRNPYIYYLKQQSLLTRKDTLGARMAAIQFLQYDSVLYYIRFPKEIMEANHILDSTYTFDTAPYLYAPQRCIDLNDCTVNESIQLKIPLFNKGEKPLKIVEITPSCDCLDIKFGGVMELQPKEKLEIDAIFTPDIVGEMIREIYIVSTSKDTPICTILINAKVNQ